MLLFFLFFSGSLFRLDLLSQENQVHLQGGFEHLLVGALAEVRKYFEQVNVSDLPVIVEVKDVKCHLLKDVFILEERLDLGHEALKVNGVGEVEDQGQFVRKNGAVSLGQIGLEFGFCESAIPKLNRLVVFLLAHYFEMIAANYVFKFSQVFMVLDLGNLFLVLFAW